MLPRKVPQHLLAVGKTYIFLRKTCIKYKISAGRGLRFIINPMSPPTYLQPVSLPIANADAGGKGPTRNTADHHRHSLLTGAVALQLYFSAQLTIGELGLVARAVDGESPVVLLTALGQQSGKKYGKQNQHRTSFGMRNESEIMISLAHTPPQLYSTLGGAVCCVITSFL